MTSARVLIVEDENIVVMELRDRLRMLGYTVAGVASAGEQSIAQAREMGPDLVLMDIRLKGTMDGIEAAEQIRARYDIPVVFLTAYSDEATLQRVKVTEPFGYLIKPFEERELRSTIEMALYKHEMERRLREQKQWLSTILTSIGDAVVATDGHGAVAFMNPVAEALTGWSAAEAMGRPSTEIVGLLDGDGQALAVDPIRKTLHDGSAVASADSTMLIARGGSKLPVDYSASPLENEMGAVSGAVLVFRDTTERQQMQQELLQRERLQAIGHFAASLAHEISNPLQAIGLTMDLILRNQIGENERWMRLQAMHDEIRRLMNLTQNTLGFVRNRPTKRQPTAIGEVIGYAQSLAGKQLEHSRIRLSVDLPPSLPLVMASSDQLVQVLLNLIVNAIDAMPSGGQVFIAAGSSGNKVTVTVRDTGPGFSADALADLFRPFHSTKPGGTGLGLSISESIVRQHGGTIRASNAPQGGALFTITLPATT